MRPLILLLCALLSIAARAEDKIKAVMYVGGGFHDYKTMPKYLADQLSALAPVTFDIRHVDTPEAMVAAFKDPKFGQGCDVIVYDICFGEKWEDGDYDAALRTAAAGKPAVFLHCSMHTYRPPRKADDPRLAEREAIANKTWHPLLGMDTRVHDKYQAFATEKVAKDHPILQGFPDDWKTPGDELYNTIKMMPTATPLLQARSPSSGKTHVVAWVNQYEKARVFSTTLGHDMKTGQDPAYHRLLANGILWACGKM